MCSPSLFSPTHPPKKIQNSPVDRLPTAFRLMLAFISSVHMVVSIPGGPSVEQLDSQCVLFSARIQLWRPGLCPLRANRDILVLRSSASFSTRGVEQIKAHQSASRVYRILLSHRLINAFNHHQVVSENRRWSSRTERQQRHVMLQPATF